MTLKSNDSLSLEAKSASQPNDLNCQSHSCASERVAGAEGGGGGAAGGGGGGGT